MKYVEYGSTQNETVIFLHGGGLAPWNYYDEAERLQESFHIIIPILDGHNGSDTDFTSIENNADEIINYVDENFHGNIFMICGLSLGGQILTEILAKRKDICKYAIIESTLVIPMKTLYAFVRPFFSICYPLVKKQWFARLQFKALHIRDSLFEDYYRDSAAISKENMTAFLKANSDYRLKESVKESIAKVLILAGSKERIHNCQKPIQMITDMVTTSSRPGDVVLDPFAGSGTTGVAAMRTGRRAVLIERDERNCEIAAKRLESEIGLFTENPKFKFEIA